MPKELKSVVIAASIFLILTGVCAWRAYVTNQLSEVVAGEIGALQKEIDELKTHASQRKGLDRELRSLNETVREFVEILPPPEIYTDERIIQDIDEWRRQSKVEVDRVARTSKLEKKQGFEEVEIRLSNLRATFEDFVAFLNAIERAQVFLMVSQFDLQSDAPKVDEDGKRYFPLRGTLFVSTFRYVGR